MAKRPLGSITAISGTVGLITATIFYYIFDCSARASVPASNKLHPYFSYSAEELQSLAGLSSDKGITEAAQEIGQSRLWSGVHFPIDDYDGLELGRKIGDWVVEKIKSSKEK